MSGIRPEWQTPDMPESERQVWEAAQRTADAAPELSPADDVYLALRPLLSGWLTPAAGEDRDAA